MNQPTSRPFTHASAGPAGEPIVSDVETNEAIATAVQKIVINIELRKKFQRAMQEEPAWEHMIQILQGTTTKKWTLELVRSSETDSDWFKTNGGYPGEVSVFFTLTGPNSLNMENERDERLVAMKDAAWGSKNQKRNWYIHRVNGETWTPPTIAQKLERAERMGDGMVTYADVEMPSDELVNLVFKDIYGVPDQVDRLINMIRSAIKSEFKFRTHAVLLGKPGSGKSYTLELAKKLFFDPSAVMFIDGTAMTSAGIIEILKNIETMPRFMFIEEIDKADPNAVQVLLGLMDRHGEIRKTTYRDNIQRECRVCVFATANSLQKIQTMQMGALFSRFGGNFITYDRNDETLKPILHREMDEYGLQMCTASKNNGRCGKCESCKTRNMWITATLKWCHEWKDKLVADTLDPRFVIDFCINGQDKLMDNRYMSMIENTSVRRDNMEEWD